MRPRFVLQLALIGAISFGLGWWIVFTASFLLGVVPHGGAW